MSRTRPQFPTTDQAHAANWQGQQDALAGIDASPWDAKTGTFVEGCLAASYRRGHSLGVQMALQRDYGDPPTA